MITVSLTVAGAQRGRFFRVHVAAPLWSISVIKKEKKTNIWIP